MQMRVCGNTCAEHHLSRGCSPTNSAEGLGVELDIIRVDPRGHGMIRVDPRGHGMTRCPTLAE